MTNQLITLKEASQYATQFLQRSVSTTNVSYLLQYGKVKKYGNNGAPLIDQKELQKYYQSFNGQRELNWKKRLGNDLNWALSFDHLREKDTTKHVHRLHPYKGKFIPQLVEYFIDEHTDAFKKAAYFQEGDIILDPFAGSGTTLVQANELNIHAIGIDISKFNCLINRVKLHDYDLPALTNECRKIQKALTTFVADNNIDEFVKELTQKLNEFNAKYFPSPHFKYQLQNGKVNEDQYALTKEKEFLKQYAVLVKKYHIQLSQLQNMLSKNRFSGSGTDSPEQFGISARRTGASLRSVLPVHDLSERRSQQRRKPKCEGDKSFLNKWYMDSIRQEIAFTFDLIKKIKDAANKQVLAIILSRTMRSCRATTHSDLATLKEPQLTPYYCHKHKKICKPLFSSKYWFTRYVNDTLTRLREFQKLRTNAYYAILAADARNLNIAEALKKSKPEIYALFKQQKIKGIFTSPPYVGQIDYHEQHAYAYDLFGFARNDALEIGPLAKGQSEAAKKAYTDDIAKVLLNCKKYLANNFDIFLVANDKHNLYPQIAAKAGLKIINQFKRPVLNRTERDKAPYAESIFHLVFDNQWTAQESE